MEKRCSKSCVIEKVACASLFVLRCDSSQHIFRRGGEVSFILAAVIILTLHVQVRVFQVDFSLEFHDFLGNHTCLQVIQVTEIFEEVSQYRVLDVFSQILKT